MKKFILILSSILLLTSCHFLEVEKTGRSDIESYFSEPQSISSAVIGVYNLLYQLQDGFMIVYPEITGDLAELSQSSSQWDKQFNFTSLESEETTAVGYIWKRAHEIILNTCEIIDHGPKILKDYPGQKASINADLAQAYFVRAFTTLELSLVYGQTYTYTPDGSHLGGTLITTFPSLSSQIVRRTVKDIYSQVIADLNTAISLWGDNSTPDDIHYASGDAAKALLSRIYLYMADYDTALSYADGLLSTISYALTPNDKYFQMFCDPSYDGSEVILRLNGLDLSKNLGSMYDAQNTKIYPSEKLKSLFSIAPEGHEDIRNSLLTYSDNTIYKGNTCMKYSVPGEELSDRERHYDPILFRSSELYLIRAECLCKKGELADAAKDISLLRSRAYGIPVEEVSVEYSTQDELDQIIMQERCKELYLEGHRLFDITRRHENLERSQDSHSQVKSITYPDDRFILPIPLVEIDANPAMKSNPINATQQ